MRILKIPSHSLFIKIAEEVAEGDTHQIDLLIIMWLCAAGNPNDPLGPEWLEAWTWSGITRLVF